MSVSSLSGASSHAFHPSSVGTSTLDSSEIPIIPMDTYVVDPAYVVHQENQTKNNTITKIEEPAQFLKVKDVGEDTSALMTCIHEKVEDMAKDTNASTTLTSKEEPKELENNNSALTTCSVIEEHSIEEFQDPSVSTAFGNDIAVPVTDCNNSNRSSSIIALGVSIGRRLDRTGPAKTGPDRDRVGPKLWAEDRTEMVRSAMEKKVKSKEKDFGTGYAMNTFDELNKILGSHVHSFKTRIMKCMLMFQVGIDVVQILGTSSKKPQLLQPHECAVDALLPPVLAVASDLVFLAGREVRKRFARRKTWNACLDRKFIDIDVKLGGSQDATPKKIKDHMKDDDVTMSELQSHLHIHKTWSTEMCKSFIDIVLKLGGTQEANPKKILEHMKQDDINIPDIQHHLKKKRDREYNLPTANEVAAIIIGDLDDTGRTRDIVEDTSKTGYHIVLPSTYKGGTRYKMQNYMDAVSLCKAFGYPDLFITFTYNQKWPEINRFVQKHNVSAEDRPDVLTRVFKQKLHQCNCLRKKHILGVVSAVEFQKRGLPHAHICVFFAKESKIPNPKDIDRLISTEIPDEQEDPELYKLVCEQMMHGPCEPHNMTLTCMKKKAHINVEWCNQSGAIKYLFKYINKGQDRVTVAFEKEKTNDNPPKRKDKIKEYYDYRYISACEAALRLYKFPIHYQYPPVQRLSFRLLPDEQPIVFEDDEFVEDVLLKPSVNNSQFLQWMEINKTDTLAQTLTYVEFPKYFVWNRKIREWTRRKKGSVVGRINYVPRSIGEAFFLRILLNKRKGPMGYEDLKTHNDKEYATIQNTCYAMGLLDDDKEERFIKASTCLGTNMQQTIRRHRNPTKKRAQHANPLGALLRKTKLIIWDEAPMTRKHAFEALDRTLRDVIDTNSSDKPFRWKTILFGGGDFRKPVIQKGTREQIVDASLNHSYNWEHCTVLKLTTNMRLKSTNNEEDTKEIKEFAD
nr:hypothetical protein [Tanacetum cinerariifolium]